MNKNNRLWELLVEKQIISQNDLDKALSIQVEYAKKWLNYRIWEILVASRSIENRKILFSLLVKNWIKLRIGELLLLLWHITDEQYREIRKQDWKSKVRKENKHFWDIAVELWFITQEVLLEFLEDAHIKLKIWEKLIKDKVITKDAMRMVLEEQRNNPSYKWKKILDILLSMKMITQMDHDKYSNKMWDLDSISFDVSSFT